MSVTAGWSVNVKLSRNFSSDGIAVHGISFCLSFFLSFYNDRARTDIQRIATTCYVEKRVIRSLEAAIPSLMGVLRKVPCVYIYILSYRTNCGGAFAKMSCNYIPCLYLGRARLFIFIHPKRSSIHWQSLFTFWSCSTFYIHISNLSSIHWQTLFTFWSCSIFSYSSKTIINSLTNIVYIWLCQAFHSHNISNTIISSFKRSSIHYQSSLLRVTTSVTALEIYSPYKLTMHWTICARHPTPLTVPNQRDPLKQRRYSTSVNQEKRERWSLKQKLYAPGPLGG